MESAVQLPEIPVFLTAEPAVNEPLAALLTSASEAIAPICVFEMTASEVQEDD
jgi:hypothetical protein